MSLRFTMLLVSSCFAPDEQLRRLLDELVVEAGAVNGFDERRVLLPVHVEAVALVLDARAHVREAVRRLDDERGSLRGDLGIELGELRVCTRLLLLPIPSGRIGKRLDRSSHG